MDFYEKMAQWKQEHGDILDVEPDDSLWPGPGPFPKPARIASPVSRPCLDWLWRLLDRPFHPTGYQR